MAGLPFPEGDRTLGSAPSITLSSAFHPFRLVSVRENPPGNDDGRPPGGAAVGPDGRAHGVYRMPTCFFTHLVVTDLGRSMGAPRARFTTSCESMPMARETENSTV